jgi:hypothetical protein
LLHHFPNPALAVAVEDLRNERLPFQWGYATVPMWL